MSFYDNIDEEDLDDPIKLVDFEQDRFIASSAKVIDVDETTWDLDKMQKILGPIDDDNETSAQQSEVRANKKPFNLSHNFFGIAENIELLNMCKTFDIKIVDCSKHTYYYRKYIRSDMNKCDESNESISFPPEIKVCESEDLKTFKGTCVEVIDKTKGVEKHNDERKLLTAKIASQEQQNKRKENWLKTRRVTEEYEKYNAISKKDSAKVNYKKNVGLIGLKIEKSKCSENVKETGQNCIQYNKITIGSHKKSDKLVTNSDKVVTKSEKVVTKSDKTGNVMPTTVLSEKNDITKKTISGCESKEVTKSKSKIDIQRGNIDKLLIIQTNSNLLDTEISKKTIQNASSNENPKNQEILFPDSNATTKYCRPVNVTANQNSYIKNDNVKQSNKLTNKPLEIKKVTKRKSNLEEQDELNKKTAKTVGAEQAVQSHANKIYALPQIKPALDLNINKLESMLKIQSGPGLVIDTPQQMNCFQNSESSMYSKNLSEKSVVSDCVTSKLNIFASYKKQASTKAKVKINPIKSIVNASFEKATRNENTKTLQEAINKPLQNGLIQNALPDSAQKRAQNPVRKLDDLKLTQADTTKSYRNLFDPKEKKQLMKQMSMHIQQSNIYKTDPKNNAQNVGLPNALKECSFVQNVTPIKGTTLPRTIQNKPNQLKSTVVAEMKTRHVASVASQKSTDLLGKNSQPPKINAIQSQISNVNHNVNVHQNVQNIPSIGNTLPFYNCVPSSMAANQNFSYNTQPTAYPPQPEWSQPYQNYNSMPPICDVVPFSDYIAVPNYNQNMPLNVNGMNPEINMYPHYVDPSYLWHAGNCVIPPPPPTEEYFIPQSKNNMDLTNYVSNVDSVIGNSSNGIIRKINILKQKQATKPSAIQNGKERVRKKVVPSKLPTVKQSPNFQRYVIASQNIVNNVTNVNQFKNVSEDKVKPAAIGKSNIQYSPPILPIPTYKNTLQFLDQISANANQDNVYVVKKDVLQRSGKNKDNLYSNENNKIPTEMLGNGIPAKKISISEYKNRLCIDLTGDDEIVRRASQVSMNRRSASQDLGYGSDSTFYMK